MFYLHYFAQLKSVEPVEKLQFLKYWHANYFHLLHLLQGYRDMATYRKVFSVVKNPPYCQVIFLKKTGNMTHMVPSAWFLKWKREHLVPITAQTQLSSSVC